MPATLPSSITDNSYDNYPPQLAANMRQFQLSSNGVILLPVTFATADATVLFTVPSTVGRFRIVAANWEVTTGFTGGTASAIGVSSSNANYNTKGDVLGGAAGDVAATLVSTGRVLKGTTGAKFASGFVVLVAGDTLKFDAVTSAFTAGAGNVYISYQLIPAS